MELKTDKVIAVYSFVDWDGPLAVLRYRGPAQAAGIHVIRGTDGESVFPERVSSADLVIIQRDFPRVQESYDQVTARARAEGKPVVYEIDDLLLELPEGHNVQAYHADLLLPMLRAILEADAITTSTPPLCAYLKQLHPNCFVLPNYLNDKLWQLCTIERRARDNDPIVVGYMGSNNHLLDLEEVAPVLLRVLNRYGNRIRLKFWGGEPPKALLAQLNVEWLAFDMTNYAEFAAYFSKQTSDIFIAPLGDNLFSRCKSGIKFLEYSALGLPGVYSRLAPYEDVIVHGQNGFLASTPGEWEECLIRLIEAPSLRHEMGAAAQETVRQNWLLSQHAQEWNETYDQVLSLRGEMSAVRRRQAQIVARVAQQAQRRVQPLLEELAAKEQRLHTLDAQVIEKEQALQAMLNSRSWRIAKRFQALRLWLVPRESLRERIVRGTIRRLHSLTPLAH